MLVVSEAALTLVLLAGAGLMARTLFNLLGQDAGVRTTNVLTFNLVLPDTTYPQPVDRGRFFDSLLTDLAALPGVVNAGATNVLPLSGNDWSISFERVDRPKPEEDQDSAEYRVITPGLLPSLGVAVRGGRGLEAGDRAGAPLVVLVSETFAKRYYGGEEPLGKQIKIGDRTPEPRTIVGVVADVREDLSAPSPPMYYIPAAQHPLDAMVVTLHSDPPWRAAPRCLMARGVSRGSTAISRSTGLPASTGRARAGRPPALVGAASRGLRRRRAVAGGGGAVRTGVLPGESALRRVRGARRAGRTPGGS